MSLMIVLKIFVTFFLFQLPKAQPLTKWQQFAQKKGIVKRKKSKFVWDEAKKEWGRRYGFNKANDDSKPWLIEVPVNSGSFFVVFRDVFVIFLHRFSFSSDPNEDQFARRTTEKKERVAKNELQRLKNIARANKINSKNFEIIRFCFFTSILVLFSVRNDGAIINKKSSVNDVRVE